MSSNTTRVTHLVAFEPKSIIVSTSCLREMNRLRAPYRPDLKLYPLPAPPKVGHKRKLTGSVQHNEPKPKKPRSANPGSPNKGKQSLGTNKTALPEKTPTKRKRAELAKSIGEQPAKKACSASQADVEFLYQTSPYKFCSVDEQWQHNICDFMGLQFRRPNKVRRGGPNVSLGPPDPHAIKSIAGDGTGFSLGLFQRALCPLVLLMVCPKTNNVPFGSTSKPTYF